MKIRTVLTVSVLVAVLSAAAVLVPSADMSDASSERWTYSGTPGVDIMYQNDAKEFWIVQDVSPGEGAYTVNVDGKTFTFTGSALKVGIEMGYTLDTKGNHLFITTINGNQYVGTLSYITYYTIGATADPSEGGSVTGAGEYASGTSVKLNAVPSEGYAFDGWYLNSEKKSENTEFTVTADSDCNYVAKFKKLTFDVKAETSTGGTVSGSGAYEYGSDAKLTAVASEGYAFDGWYDGETKVSESAEYSFKVTKAVSLTAKWKLNQYTISFDTDGGSPAVDKITADYGTSVKAPTVSVIKDGYIFQFWSKDGTTEYAFSTMPAENITLKAVWRSDKYTISFDTDGGSEVAKISADYGAKVTAPEDPTKTGYTFVNWTLDGKEYSFGTMPAKDITLKAAWNVNKYTISFDTDGGSPSVDKIEQDYGTAVTAPSEKPTKTGYTFQFWSKDGTTEYTFSTMPAENITLKAVWQIVQYTISFDTDGGSAVSAVTADCGSAVTAPKSPVKASDGLYDYTFVNWTLDGKEYSFTVMPSENITLKAQYSKVFSADTESDANITADDTGKTEMTEEVIEYIKENSKTTVVKTETAEVKIPAEVISKITENTASEDKTVVLTVGKKDASVLNDAQKKAVGNAPIISAELTVGSKPVHELGGKITVTIPADELGGIPASKAAVYYLKDDGSTERMETVVNDDGSVSFETDHFSYYFVKEITASEGTSVAMIIALAIVVILAAVILSTGLIRRKAQ